MHCHKAMFVRVYSLKKSVHFHMLSLLILHPLALVLSHCCAMLLHIKAVGGWNTSQTSTRLSPKPPPEILPPDYRRGRMAALNCFLDHMGACAWDTACHIGWLFFGMGPQVYWCSGVVLKSSATSVLLYRLALISGVFPASVFVSEHRGPPINGLLRFSVPQIHSLLCLSSSEIITVFSLSTVEFTCALPKKVYRTSFFAKKNVFSSCSVKKCVWSTFFSDVHVDWKRFQYINLSG